MFSKGSSLAVSRNLNQTSDLVKWTAPVSDLWFKKEKKNTSHHMHESDITGGLFCWQAGSPTVSKGEILQVLPAAGRLSN